MAALTDNEAKGAWQNWVEAEVRSLYFADLAASYTKRKQLITGVSFFLSSGAAATLLGKSPTYVPISLSIGVALVTAYSIAVNLDQRIATLVRLHSQWNQLSLEYERLWNHWYDEGASRIFGELSSRAADASEHAIQMPYDKGRLHKWEDAVFSRFAQVQAE